MQSAYFTEEVLFIMIDPVGIRQAVVIELARRRSEYDHA
jgi:hypothetical protein